MSLLSLLSSKISSIVLVQGWNNYRIISELESGWPFLLDLSHVFNSDMRLLKLLPALSKGRSIYKIYRCPVPMLIYHHKLYQFRVKEILKLFTGYEHCQKSVPTKSRVMEFVWSQHHVDAVTVPTPDLWLGYYCITSGHNCCCFYSTIEGRHVL